VGGGVLDVETQDALFEVDGTEVSESGDSSTKSQSSLLRCSADACILSK
jgi:hypothetical protein